MTPKKRTQTQRIATLEQQVVRNTLELRSLIRQITVAQQEEKQQ